MTSSTLARIALFTVAWIAGASFGGAQATPRSTTFALVKTDSASRGGTIQVIFNSAGVEITGTVDGSTPRWPSSPRDIPKSDRVEVSIADVHSDAVAADRMGQPVRVRVPRGHGGLREALGGHDAHREQAVRHLVPASAAVSRHHCTALRAPVGHRADAGGGDTRQAGICVARRKCAGRHRAPRAIGHAARPIHGGSRRSRLWVPPNDPMERPAADAVAAAERAPCAG